MTTPVRTRYAGYRFPARLDIAQAHRDCDVPRDVLVHQRRAWRYRVRRIDDHRQGFVIDRDELGGVARLRFARGDNDRDPLADIAHPPDRQRRPPGAVTLGPPMSSGITSGSIVPSPS